ncbi:MAG: BatD family protein [Planctomycetota bacterium]
MIALPRPCRLLLAMLLVCLLAQCARAQQIAVDARTTGENAVVGKPYPIQIQINGARSPDQPTMPEVEGAEVFFRGGSPATNLRTSIVNGVVRQTGFDGYIFNYDLVPTRAGPIDVPPFTVRVNGRTYRTETLRIRTIEAGEDPDVTVFLDVDNPEPYLGEPVRVTVSIALERSARDAEINIPGVREAFEMESAPLSRPPLSGDPRIQMLGDQVTFLLEQREIDGEVQDVFSGSVILIPRQHGEIIIGPAVATAEIVLRPGRSLFDSGQVRDAVAASDPITLRVRPLPTTGVPSDFTGLVGAYSVRSRIDRSEVNVGDPIEMRVEVFGARPHTIPAPDLERDPAFADGFRVTLDESASVVERDRARFIYRIRPTRDDLSAVPGVRVPYFDTSTGSYEVARSPEIFLRVRETKVVTADDAVRATPSEPEQTIVPEFEGYAGEISTGINHNYVDPDAVLRDERFSLFSAALSPVVLAAGVLPPIAYAGTLAFVGVRRRLAQRDERIPKRRRAMSHARRRVKRASKGPREQVPDAVSQGVTAYFAAFAERPPSGMTSADCARIVREQRGAAANKLASELEELLGACDAARYGGVSPEQIEALPARALATLSKADSVLKGGA